MEPLSYDSCLPEAVHFSSRNLTGWPTDIVVNYDEFKPFEHPLASFVEDHLCLNLGTSARLRYTPKDGHPAHDGPVRPGGGLLCPAGLAVGWHLRTPTKAMSIRFKPNFLRSFAETEGVDPARVELHYAAPLYDPILVGCCTTLLKLMRSPVGCALTAGKQIETLTIYLLESRVTRPLVPTRRSPSATDGSVRRAKAIIEERFCELDLRVESLAAKLGISKRQFHRIFEKTEMGSPWDYVIRLRVARAKELLVRRPGLSNYDIAFEVGFTDPKLLNDHFKKLVGVSLAGYRTGHR